MGQSMTDTTKEKLIIAGINEIENHGIAGFSLRRVASECSVSCAAPYKHFKSKEDFIFEIIKYIHAQWELLMNQVAEIYAYDEKKQIVEICIAYIKFWIANPRFRSVLMMNNSEVLGEKGEDFLEISKVSHSLIQSFCSKNAISKHDELKKIFIIRSIIYGATTMLDNGEIENTDETISIIRETIEEQL